MAVDFTAIPSSGSQGTVRSASDSASVSDKYREMMKDIMNSAKNDKTGSSSGRDTGKPGEAAKPGDDGNKEEKGLDESGSNADGTAAWIAPDAALSAILWMQQPGRGNTALTGPVPEDIRALQQTAAADGTPVILTGEDPVTGVTGNTGMAPETAAAKAQGPDASDMDPAWAEAKTVVQEPPVTQQQVLQEKPEGGETVQTAEKSGTGQPEITGDTRKASEKTQEGVPEQGMQANHGVWDSIAGMQPDAAAGEQPVNGTFKNSEEIAGKLPGELFDRLAAGEKDFTLQLEPESLGKLVIKASYENGRAMVSIQCTNEKTLELLSGHARELGSILEGNLGTPTSVYLERTEHNYLDQGRSDQGGQQNYPQEEQDKKKHSGKEESMDFLQQLRLGLV